MAGFEPCAGGVCAILDACVCVQAASVGITEEEAKAQGINYKVGKFSFMANSRARAVASADGLVSHTAAATATAATRGLTTAINSSTISSWKWPRMMHERAMLMQYVAPP